MSRIGLKPIKIPEGVEIKIETGSIFGGQRIVVKGPLGHLEQDLRKDILCRVDTDRGEAIFERSSESKFVKSLHGLYRSLVANMIRGISKGHEKDLEMIGIGYKAEVKGSALEIIVGATHPFTIEAPEGIEFDVRDKVNIKVKGTDKQLVGQVAARIRAVAKPEPYKGKGIRYKGEYVRRKEGKVAKAAEGGGE